MDPTPVHASPRPRVVADLPGARMPADRGLSGLGLLMQLGGSVFLALMGLVVVSLLFSGGSFQMWPVLLIALLGAVRSGFHRAAGSALLYGSPSGPLRPIQLYLGASLAQTAFALLFAHRLTEGDPRALVTVALLLLCWPAVLAVVIASRRVRAIAAEPPLPEDLGYEGVSVLMALFGAIGVGTSALLVVMFVRLLPELPVIGALLLALILLAARSALQLRAGVRGVRGAASDRIAAAADRYTSFGVVAGIGATASVLVLLMMSQPSVMDLLVIGLMLYLLLVWPTTLRRFFTERNFAVMLAEQDAPVVVRRAPDAGLTALGWLLIASSAVSFAVTVPDTLFDLDLAQLLFEMVPDATSLAGRPSQSWLELIAPAFQLWAGIELVRMTDRHKLAATLYGVVAAVVTVYVMWPTMTSMLGGTPLAGMFDPSSLLGGAALALSLIVPVGTILLVNRRWTPAARVVHQA